MPAHNSLHHSDPLIRRLSSIRTAVAEQSGLVQSNTRSTIMGLSNPFMIVLVGLGVNTVHGSLMNRIGLRLGGKPFHEQQEHRARVPWAVKQMREDLLAEERKPWQDSRNSKWGYSVIWGCRKQTMALWKICCGYLGTFLLLNMVKYQ